MSRIRFLARVRVRKYSAFEFTFGMEPVVQLTAWFFPTFEDRFRTRDV